MKNVEKFYEKYYDAYKSDYDANDELNETKKKKFDYTEFELVDKTCEESKLTALPKWLSSKNNFNEEIKLIEDIRADRNNVKSSSGDKKVFNDLNGLINDIKNKKTTRKSTIKKIKDIFSNLDQQNQKESTVFQNKMIDVVYYLFNSLGITSHPGRLMLPKWVKVSEKRFNEILSTVTEAINNEFTTNVDARETTLDNTESLLKGIGSGKIDKRELKKTRILLMMQKVQ